MLEEKWEQISQVIAETANFFQLPLPDPQGIYGQCLDFFLKHDKLVIKLGPDVYLVFEEQRMLSKINIYLISEQSITDKRDWEKSLTQFEDDFSPSYIGSSFKPETDHFLDIGLVLTDDIEEESDLGENPDDDHGGLFQKEEEPDDNGGLFQKPDVEVAEPEPDKTYECPGCSEQLTHKDDHLYCDNCEEDIYLCPRCGEVLEEYQDPKECDYGKCDDCNKAIVKIDCPNCEKEIWPDQDECPHCHQQFELNECPECPGMNIKGANPDNCPYCGEDIYPCPRCGEHFSSDPEGDEYYCETCEKTFTKIKCPECKKEIYADEETCPHCHVEFEKALAEINS